MTMKFVSRADTEKTKESVKNELIGKLASGVALKTLHSDEPDDYTLELFFNTQAQANEVMRLSSAYFGGNNGIIVTSPARHWDDEPVTAMNDIKRPAASDLKHASGIFFLGRNPDGGDNSAPFFEAFGQHMVTITRDDRKVEIPDDMELMSNTKKLKALGPDMREFIESEDQVASLLAAIKRIPFLSTSQKGAGK